MTWKKGVIGLTLGMGVAVGLWITWSYRQPSKILRLPGVVEIQEIRLGSRVAGRVSDVFISEGDQVQAGQPLVRVDVPELEAQRDQITARLREVESALEKARNGPRQEEKDAARAAADSSRARLKKLKAGNREEEIRQARGEFEAWEAEIKLAREEFDRADRLYRKNAGTKAEYDLAMANLNRGISRHAAARARLDLVLAGTRPEEIEEAAADLQRLEANWRLLQAGTRSEEIAEAEARAAEARGKLREIDVNLREAVVTAPEPAVVEVLTVRRGDLVQANQPIIRVLRTADMWIKTYVPETDLGKVRLNAVVEVTVDSYPGRRFSGQIMQINSESEFTPRNVQSVDERRHQMFGLKVRVKDPQGVFKSGMAAEVFLPVE